MADALLPGPHQEDSLASHVTDNPVLSRLGLALLMVVVAALGAAIALWTALTELRTSELQRRLTLGKMFEIGVRAATIQEVGLREQLDNLARDHRSAATAMQESARRLRANGASEAARLEVDAQLQNAQARLIRAFVFPLRSLGSGDNLWQRLDRSVEGQLTRIGFNRYRTASAAQDHPASGTGESEVLGNTFSDVVERNQLPTWRATSHRIEELHHAVPRLALVVAGFVAALLCFSLADLRSHYPRRSTAYLAAGLTVAAVSGACALWADSSSWQPMAAVLAISGVLITVSWRLGFFKHVTAGETAHLPELEPRTFFGSNVMLRHAGDNREKLIVLLIAWTVLLSSVVGYRYASAQSEATGAAHRAFASEAAFNNLNSERTVVAVSGGLIPTLQLFNARLKCAFASQRSLSPPAGATPQVAKLLEEERNRQCAPLKTDDNVRQAGFIDSDTILLDTGQSPGHQIISSMYYGYNKYRNATPAQLYAMSDGYISLASWRDKRAAVHLVGLTLFAIALYLLGQSLGMGEGVPSNTLAFTGAAMALFAFSLSTWQAFRTPSAPTQIPAACALSAADAVQIRHSPERAIEIAADFYGRAKYAYETAQNRSNYQTAAGHFDCATAVRPEFAIAHRERSLAYSKIDQLDADGSFTSFLARDRLPTAVASQLRTLTELEAAGWWLAPSQMSNLGFDIVLEALSTAKPAKLDAAIAILQRAVTSLLPRPAGHVAKSASPAAQVADLPVFRQLNLNLGLAQLAKGQIAAAIASYTKVVKELSPADDPELIAATISDLNILEASCAQLHAGPAANARCGSIFETIDTLRQGLLDGRFDKGAMPGATLSEVTIDVHPSGVRWGASLGGLEPGRDRLTVLWTSYVPEWNAWRVIQPLHKLAGGPIAAVSGPTSKALVFDGGAGSCLAPGKYRAEFYVNGRRISPADDPGVEVDAYDEYRSREMNIALCQPVGWTTSAFRENAEGRHLIRAFVNAQGKSAGYVFTFFAPLEDSPDRRKREYRDKAWQLLKRFSTSTPDDTAFNAAIERFRGCDAPVPGGTVLHKTWATPDGTIHVAFVIGDFAKGQACHVLRSIGNYYDRGQAGELALD